MNAVFGVNSASLKCLSFQNFVILSAAENLLFTLSLAVRALSTAYAIDRFICLFAFFATPSRPLRLSASLTLLSARSVARPRVCVPRAPQKIRTRIVNRWEETVERYPIPLLSGSWMSEKWETVATPSTLHSPPSRRSCPAETRSNRAELEPPRCGPHRDPAPAWRPSVRSIRADK